MLKCPKCDRTAPLQIGDAEVYCQGQIDKGYGNRHKPVKMKEVK